MKSPRHRGLALQGPAGDPNRGEDGTTCDILTDISAVLRPFFASRLSPVASARHAALEQQFRHRELAQVRARTQWLARRVHDLLHVTEANALVGIETELQVEVSARPACHPARPS
jgi:hypothetical protein